MESGSLLLDLGEQGDEVDGLFETQKLLLIRGVEALQEVWMGGDGTVTMDVDAEPRERIPTVYFVPSGEEGDAALAAIAEDYEKGPTGSAALVAPCGLDRHARRGPDAG